MKPNPMKINSFYPVICSEDVKATAEFYRTHFDFDATFEADWYVSLRAAGNTAYELAILDYTHQSLPEGFRKPAGGVLLNIEVPDADREYGRLKASGLTMALDIRSEDWGQRHFIVIGPDEVLIDVIQVIPPTGEFAE